MNKYISKGRRYSLMVMVDGAVKMVNFRPESADSTRGMFITNDAYLASAMERHPRFNECFFKESGTLETIAPKKEDIHQFNKVYDYVHKTCNAIDILIKEYGCKRGSVRTKKDVLTKAMEFNISFPNL